MKTCHWLCICLAGLVCAHASLHAAESEPKFRILHVPSYHMEWVWNQDQFRGFKDALNDLDIEYRIVELDTKRSGDEAAITEKAARVKAVIDEWKPDLVYTNDDHAQTYVTKHYLGSSIPFVFSAVNKSPEEYGFPQAGNVTGVLEHEHIAATLELLRRVVPGVKKIVVIADKDPTWEGVKPRFMAAMQQIPELELAEWAVLETFDQYKQKIKAYQNSRVAIASLGVFNFKDDDGKEVDYEQVLRWTVDNSRLPDFSFWETRVERGTLCVVAVAGYLQGSLAGDMARRILLDKVKPGDIPMQPSAKGTPIISLARARLLDIKPDANLLLSIDAKTTFIWQ